ncbi:MAG: molecular chaperone DnaK [Tissierellia bacterium]|nr:molecular chaperone DnaK [Tissierellia bacterium]
MDWNKREFFKDKLLQEQERISVILHKMNTTLEYGAMDEYLTELSVYDNHPADIGTEMFMMEQDKGLKNKLKDTLYEIDISLGDIDEGSYGLCIDCGKPIEESRLELIPYIKLCIDCSNKKLPLNQKRNFRPEEEDSISPFSKNYDEDDAMDREDSYQAVARYNRIEGDPSFATGDDIGTFDDEEANEGIVEDVDKISQDYYDKTK